MTLFWNGLRDFPSTNAKMFVGVCLEILYTIVLLWCIATNRSVNLEVAGGLGAFVLAVNGITTAQFYGKRTTDKEYMAAKMANTPSPVNVEDAREVNVTQEQPATPPAVAVEPLVSRPAASPRVLQPLTHRESEKD